MNETGAFYTKNKKLLDYFCHLLPLNLFDKKDIKILEPSSGQGDIIIHILRKIKNKQQFLKNLTINEIDKKSLFFSLEQINQITNSENLIEICNDDFIFGFNSKDKFDYIIGNPPYISYYGRRGIKKNEEWRNKVINSFEQYKGIKNGKINSIQLFIEKSINLLRNDNSKILFILDGNFNEKPYILIRKFIFDKGFHITKIVKNLSEFDNVASGQMIIQIEKIKNDILKTEIIDYNNGDSFNKKYKTKDFVKNNFKYELNQIDKETINLISNVDLKSKPYQEIYPLKTMRTCSMLLNLEQEFIKEKQKPTKENEFFYYIGSKSVPHKFQINSVNKILVYDKNKAYFINENIKKELEKQGIKNKKRVMLGDIIAFNNPKIFIRQSANSIITSFDDKKSTANNSLYMICSTQNYKFKKDELYFLTGYLNSSIITKYAKAKYIIRSFKGKQPQISLSDLRKIPVIENLSIKNKIIKIVKDIYKNKILIENGLKKIDMILSNYFLK